MLERSGVEWSEWRGGWTDNRIVYRRKGEIRRRRRRNNKQTTVYPSAVRDLDELGSMMMMMMMTTKERRSATIKYPQQLQMRERERKNLWVCCVAKRE